jgi:very-short-patch-repair endonuclease
LRRAQPWRTNQARVLRSNSSSAEQRLWSHLRSSDAEMVRDSVRTAALKRLGYRIFRVHNIEIYENFDGVLDSLVAFIENGP